jgi:hypothetical protein
VFVPGKLFQPNLKFGRKKKMLYEIFVITPNYVLIFTLASMVAELLAIL